MSYAYIYARIKSSSITLIISFHCNGLLVKTLTVSVTGYRRISFADVVSVILGVIELQLQPQNTEGKPPAPTKASNDLNHRNDLNLKSTVDRYGLSLIHI